MILVSGKEDGMHKKKTKRNDIGRRNDRWDRDISL